MWTQGGSTVGGDGPATKGAVRVRKTEGGPREERPESPPGPDFKGQLTSLWPHTEHTWLQAGLLSAPGRGLPRALAAWAIAVAPPHPRLCPSGLYQRLVNGRFHLSR